MLPGDPSLPPIKPPAHYTGATTPSLLPTSAPRRPLTPPATPSHPPPPVRPAGSLLSQLHPTLRIPTPAGKSHDRMKKQHEAERKRAVNQKQVATTRRQAAHRYSKLVAEIVPADGKKGRDPAKPIVLPHDGAQGCSHKWPVAELSSEPYQALPMGWQSGGQSGGQTGVVLGLHRRLPSVIRGSTMAPPTRPTPGVLSGRCEGGIFGGTAHTWRKGG